MGNEPGKLESGESGDFETSLGPRTNSDPQRKMKGKHSKSHSKNRKKKRSSSSSGMFDKGDLEPGSKSKSKVNGSYDSGLSEHDSSDLNSLDSDYQKSLSGRSKLAISADNLYKHPEIPLPDYVRWMDGKKTKGFDNKSFFEQSTGDIFSEEADAEIDALEVADFSSLNRSSDSESNAGSEFSLEDIQSEDEGLNETVIERDTNENLTSQEIVKSDVMVESCLQGVGDNGCENIICAVGSVGLAGFNNKMGNEESMQQQQQAEKENKQARHTNIDGVITNERPTNYTSELKTNSENNVNKEQQPVVPDNVKSKPDINIIESTTQSNDEKSRVVPQQEITVSTVLKHAETRQEADLCKTNEYSYHGINNNDATDLIMDVSFVVEQLCDSVVTMEQDNAAPDLDYKFDNSKFIDIENVNTINRECRLMIDHIIDGIECSENIIEAENMGNEQAKAKKYSPKHKKRVGETEEHLSTETSTALDNETNEPLENIEVNKHAIESDDDVDLAQVKFDIQETKAVSIHDDCTNEVELTNCDDNFTNTVVDETVMMDLIKIFVQDIIDRSAKELEHEYEITNTVNEVVDDLVHASIGLNQQNEIEREQKFSDTVPNKQIETTDLGHEPPLSQPTTDDGNMGGVVTTDYEAAKESSVDKSSESSDSEDTNSTTSADASFSDEEFEDCLEAEEDDEGVVEESTEDAGHSPGDEIDFKTNENEQVEKSGIETQNSFTAVVDSVIAETEVSTADLVSQDAESLSPTENDDSAITDKVENVVNDICHPQHVKIRPSDDTTIKTNPKSDLVTTEQEIAHLEVEEEVEKPELSAPGDTENLELMSLRSSDTAQWSTMVETGDDYQENIEDDVSLSEDMESETGIEITVTKPEEPSYLEDEESNKEVAQDKLIKRSDTAQWSTVPQYGDDEEQNIDEIVGDTDEVDNVDDLDADIENKINGNGEPCDAPPADTINIEVVRSMDDGCETEQWSTAPEVDETESYNMEEVDEQPTSNCFDEEKSSADFNEYETESFKTGDFHDQEMQSIEMNPSLSEFFHARNLHTPAESAASEWSTKVEIDELDDQRSITESNITTDNIDDNLSDDCLDSPSVNQTSNNTDSVKTKDTVAEIINETKENIDEKTKVTQPSEIIKSSNNDLVTVAGKQIKSREERMAEKGEKLLVKKQKDEKEAIKWTGSSNKSNYGSLTSLSLLSRKSSSDSATDPTVKELKEALSELEEKYKQAMVQNAQLDNEKAVLNYRVETMKDLLEEQDEELYRLRNTHKTTCQALVKEKRLHGALEMKMADLQEALRQRDELIQALMRQLTYYKQQELENKKTEQGLVMVGGNNMDDSSDDSTDGQHYALVTQEAAQVLESAGDGPLNQKLKHLAEERNDLLDEVRRLRQELEEERNNNLSNNKNSYVENGVGDMQLLEIQRDASRQISEYKFKLQKCEQDTSAYQANISRLEQQLQRIKATSEALERSEDEMRADKRKLQRDLRATLDRMEELEMTNSHLEKRLERMRAQRGSQA